MEGQQFETNIGEIDLSDTFLDLSVEDFAVEVRRLRKVPRLKIDIDLSSVDDNTFISQARMLKAFIDNRASGQERVAIVRARGVQRLLDPNAFESGVKFEEI